MEYFYQADDDVEKRIYLSDIQKKIEDQAKGIETIGARGNKQKYKEIDELNELGLPINSNDQNEDLQRGDSREFELGEADDDNENNQADKNKGQGDLSLQKDIRQPLLQKQPGKNNDEQDFGCIYGLRRCLGMTVSKENRTIELNGRTKPKNFPTNKMNNQKYSWISFFPKVLFNQFKFFFNMFFLVIAMTQFIPFLKVGLIVTYTAPLAFVILVTMLKEAMDDYMRKQRDKDMNGTKYQILVLNKQKNTTEVKTIKSQDIKVGQIMKLKHNQRVPADLLLIKGSERNGSVFIRTDQLDGETDWKLRKACSSTQPLEEELLLNFEVEITCLPPNEQIYDFRGKLKRSRNSDEDDIEESLSLDNTMWQNTVIASQGDTYGLILYTGKDTRSSLNGKNPRSKFGKIDLELNRLSKILFLTMCFIAMLIIVVDGFVGQWYFKYFRCVLLLCAIIPISMRLNLDIAKIYYSNLINKDKEIEGAVVRNSQIPEELGRIQFLLSDKTGTLTKNDMIFKKLNLEYYSFTEENIEDIKNLLNKGLKKKRDQMKSSKLNDDTNMSYFDNLNDSILDPDTYAMAKPSTGTENSVQISKQKFQGGSMKSIDDALSDETGQQKIDKKRANIRRGKRREQHQIVLDLFLALILCHNVTPIYEPVTDEEKKENEGDHQLDTSKEHDTYKKSFQAASPDDVALVKFAESLDMTLEEREESLVTIKDSSNVRHTYDILQNFPFSSETKRMGIILRERETERIMFYVKGAEVVMEDKISPEQRVSMTESCEQLASDGLRTLVISQKVLEANEYERFKEQYKAAKMDMYNKEERMDKALASIENALEFLAVTGVEDKLQDHVLETIEKFRGAGIQVWMLTGDKIETAKCIAIATGMNRKTEKVHEIRGDQGQVDTFHLKELINQYDQVNKDVTMLMVDGTALAVILNDDELKKRFFTVACDAKSVCVCRCSPTQKSLVARYIKFYSKKNIACVGDGGNDVAMIQEADVGLGIVGKEGMQASLAADFSILQFSHLKDLVLWHGRMSYQRSAKLSQFVIHRGMIISFIQAIFTMTFFSVTIPIYNGYLILGYSTIYTSLPVIALVLDEDVEREVCLKFPILYKNLQAGRYLNFKTFMIWTWKSMFQAAVIMFLAIILFHDSFLMVMSITFTALICIEFLNVYQEMTKATKGMFISISLSVISYGLSILCFNNLFQIQIFEVWFFVKVGIITTSTFLPLWAFKKIVHCYDPDMVSKINKGHHS